MEWSFPRYLQSKISVDDRAINRQVFDALRGALPQGGQLRVIEVGAGIGSMLRRLMQWGLFEQADYTAMDEAAENIAYARQWLPRWAGELGLRTEERRLWDAKRDIKVDFIQADVFDYVRSRPQPARLLVAHAFLDLLPLPGALPQLFSLLEPGGLAWLTLNFDGVTIFEPPVDPQFEAQVEALYHRSMDERLTGGVPSGDSHTGRHLFTYLRQVGAEILAAGASDWVVYPRAGGYPADEAYFLDFILHFFESSLASHPQLDQSRFARWLVARRAQVAAGELVYIVHQMDFLVRMS